MPYYKLNGQPALDGAFDDSGAAGASFQQGFGNAAPDAPGVASGLGGGSPGTDEFPDFEEIVGHSPGADATGNAADSTTATNSSTSSTTQTLTSSGSGLVFNNTFGSGATQAFINEVDAAESYLQSLFGNSCTVNCSFDVQNLHNTQISGENSFDPIEVSYSQFVNALTQHASTPVAQQAAAALASLPDPSHGALWEIPIGEALILGLPITSRASPDDSVILNSQYWTSSALANNPTDAEAVIEHELTEGIMGRIGSLGTDGGDWAPMDLFRFTANGQRDFTGGQDGQTTYFSVNGSNPSIGLQFHNSIGSNGISDGFDLADWDQVGGDANATDPFGPGGPGAGDPGTLSATDIAIMQALGWAPPPPPAPPTVTANGPTVNNGQTVAVDPTVFTVSGSGISEYEVWFSAANQGAPALGSVTENGSAIALNQGVFLTSLNGLNYIGGATAGTDEMWLRAYNGTWSSWVQANITDPGAVAPATVTAQSPTVGNAQSVAVSPTVFSVSGSGITQYEVWFSAANQGAPALGSVTYNGNAIALNQGVFLTSLSGLNYIGGASAGTDEMWLRAYNGSWSGWVQANITDPGGSGAVAVTAQNPTITTGERVAVSPTIFSVNGSGITQYEVWFSAANQGAPALGSVTYNNSAIALNQGVFLTSLGGLDYTGGATAGTDEMWLRAYNGTWSSWVQANITDPGSAGAPAAQTGPAVGSDGSSPSGWWGGADAGWLSSYVAPYQSAASAAASSGDFLAAGLQGADAQETWGGGPNPGANLSWSADPAGAGPLAGAPQSWLSDLMTPANLAAPMAGGSSPAPAAQFASSEPSAADNAPVIWAGGTALQHLT